MTAPAVGIIPSGHRLGAHSAALPLADLRWPLGLPDRLQGKTLGDLDPRDHVITFPFTPMHWARSFGTPARVSVMIMEPAAVHRRHLVALRLTHRRFHSVLSFDPRAVAHYRNGILLPFGSTWVPEWASLTLEKTKPLSLIASDRRKLEGHRLRHTIADHIRATGLQADIMGRGYTPFEAKSDGLAPYRFSVIIENVRERDYFSEKLIDAILCETVPIYWGCPNIGDYLDTSGMILCKSEADIRAALTDCTPARYDALAPALRAIKERAAHYGALYERAAKALLERGD